MAKTATKSKSATRLVPLGDRVVLKRAESESTTAGGIVLPDSARDKPQKGEVVAIGDGHVKSDGKRVARRHARERNGRDPSTLVLSAMSTVLVGAGGDELRRRSRVMIDRGYGEGETDPDALVAANRDTWVCGTVDEAVQRLGELREAGVERMMLQHLLHDDVDAVELFGAELR